MSTGTPFPSPSTLVYQLPIFMVFEDTYHYWIHRALHWGPLYKHVHKTHHQLAAPFGLAAEYASPIELFILGLGTGLCPLLWSLCGGEVHLVTLLIWGMLRVWHSTNSHSGYQFPLSLSSVVPFWASTRHHDMHHENFVGNYASYFAWWDYFMNTQIDKEAAARKRWQGGWSGKG